MTSTPSRPALASAAALQPIPRLELSLRLFRQLAESAAGKNVILSPFSIWLLLALLREGSEHITRAELSALLGVGITDDVTSEVARFTRLFTSASVTLNVANGMWVDPDCTIRAEFLAIAEQCYKATIDSFEHQPGQTVAKINDWVSAQTMGKIPFIVEQLDSAALLAAINAVYFHGLWQIPFEPSLTQPRKFHLSNGIAKQVPMMHAKKYFRYFEDMSFQVIWLPYDNSSWGMYVVLPKQGIFSRALSKVISSEQWTSRLMQPPTWEHLTARSESVLVDLKLPRFRMESQFDLKPVLQALGLVSLFDADRATLSGISPTIPLAVDQMRHKAFAEVTEEGTEAAAASFAGIMCTSSMWPRVETPIHMTVDHPFAFVIQERGNPLPLFVGLVEEP